MIAKFSVKKPYTVLVAVVMVIILGVVSFTKMTSDLLPSINLPYVIVMTTYVGASPETVEMVVTKPVEASMATVSNVENISSVSSENYSMVILEFTQSANMDSASLEIREKLDQVKYYWDDTIGNPIIMKLNPDMLPIMVAAVGVEGMTTAQISDYTSSKLIPELESIEGVASASASGLLEESVHVIIREDKIAAVNEQVFGAIDSEMEDARKELADGRKELADGKAEIADGWKEIDENIADLEDAKKELADGRQEIADKKNELQSGKDELASKKEQAANEIAQNYTKLVDGKSEIASGKAALTVSIGQMKQQLTLIEIKKNLKTLKDSVVYVRTMPGVINIADIPTTVDSCVILKNSLIQMGYTEDMSLSDVQTDLETKLSSPTFASVDESDSAKATLETQLAALQAQLTELEANEAKLDQALTALTKGEMEAAAGFGSADAQLAYGEAQLNAAESQLESSQKQIDSGLEQIDSAKEQLRDAEEQLKEAEEQLRDGEKQLEDARVDAYNNADMNGILTVDTVKSLLMAQNFSMPGGYVTEEGVDYLVRVGDKPADVKELAAMPIMNVNMEGVDVITLEDVADVFMSDNSADIYANLNGNPGVLISMQKQTGYSTGDVSRKINDKFEELMGENENLSLIGLMDQGVYIDLVMDSIFQNIIYGFGLALIILILFLKDFKPTLIIACSIPISLVAAVVCMYFSGVTLNVISLSGLALGIGMLVDNSIVVIENIYRLRSEGASMVEAAVEGAKEVAGAIAASTLTTVCVFAPIVFTEGITRQLFVDMGLTIGYSLLASLIMALTVVPAMASKVLTSTKSPAQGGFFERLSLAYEKVLAACLKVKPLVLIGAVVLLLISGWASLSKGTAFMPEMDSNQLSLTITMPNGTPLEKTADVADEVVSRLGTLEDVENVGAMLGQSTMSMLGGGSSDSTNQVSMYVTTKEKKSKTNQELAREMETLLADLEDVEINIQTASADMSALGGSGISIQVRGRELDTLQTIAGEVASIVQSVEGTTEVLDGMEESTGEMRILIDRKKAMDYSLTIGQIFSQISSKLATPTSATTLATEIKEYDVYVINGKDSALTREDLKNIDIDTTDKDGKKVKVPLSELADFEEKESLKSIQRSEQTRYITVSAMLEEGYNIGLVSSQVKKALEDYELPSGYTLYFSGENETIMEAMKQLMLMLALAIAFMYLIMVAQFQSLKSPFIIMFTIPLAFTGGFMGLFFTNSEVSVIAVIGFIMLSGIIVNNGIVLVDYMNQLRERGMDKKEAILQAGKTRLRPVLMTALTTIFGLLTMAFGAGMGADMSRPMAVVTIGGLTYGTLLTLIVIPCIYDIFNSGKKKTEKAI